MFPAPYLFELGGFSRPIEKNHQEAAISVSGAPIPYRDPFGGNVEREEIEHVGQDYPDRSHR